MKRLRWNIGVERENGIGRLRMLEEVFPRFVHFTLFPRRNTGKLFPFGRVMLASSSCFHFMQAKADRCGKQKISYRHISRTLLRLLMRSDGVDVSATFVVLVGQDVDVSLGVWAVLEKSDSVREQPSVVRFSILLVYLMRGPARLP